MTSFRPSRGDVWFVDFGEPVGHEQGFRRPALVISVDGYNHGPAELAVVVPLTTRNKGLSWQVAITPPEGGLPSLSYVKCDDIRSVSMRRFSRYVGQVSAETVAQVENRLRILLDL